MVYYIKTWVHKVQYCFNMSTYDYKMRNIASYADIWVQMVQQSSIGRPGSSECAIGFHNIVTQYCSIYQHTVYNA